MMTTIILMVPGQTDWSAEGRLRGDVSLPMNDMGIVTVARNVSKLKDTTIDFIAVSQSEDALQTAEIVHRTCGGKIKQFSELNEPYFGVWQGMTTAEIEKLNRKIYRQWLSNPLSVLPSRAESLEDCFRRAQRCVRKILKKFSDGTVAIVTGSFVNAMLYCYLKDLDFKNLMKYMRQPGELEIVRIR